MAESGSTSTADFEFRTRSCLKLIFKTNPARASFHPSPPLIPPSFAFAARTKINESSPLHVPNAKLNGPQEPGRAVRCGRKTIKPGLSLTGVGFRCGASRDVPLPLCTTSASVPGIVRGGLKLVARGVQGGLDRYTLHTHTIASVPR